MAPLYPGETTPPYLCKDVSYRQPTKIFTRRKRIQSNTHDDLFNQSVPVLDILLNVQLERLSAHRVQEQLFDILFGGRRRRL